MGTRVFRTLYIHTINIFIYISAQLSFVLKASCHCAKETPISKVGFQQPQSILTFLIPAFN